MNRLKFDKNGLTSLTRTYCVLTFASQAVGIKPNGNQLEITFSHPLKTKRQQLSGKYNKCLNMTCLPGEKTVRELEHLAPGCTELFNAPIWSAMQFIEYQREDIDTVLSTLDIELLTIIYNPKRNEHGNLVRRKLFSKDIKAIFTLGTYSAISCLILLRYEFDKRYCSVSKRTLENYITKCFINICATDLLPTYQFKVYSALNKILYSRSSSTLNLLAENELESKVASRKRLLNQLWWLLRNLYDESITSIVSLLTLADQKLITRELKLVSSEVQYTLSPKADRGLLWLLSKLKTDLYKNDFRLQKIIKHFTLQKTDYGSV